MASKAAIRTIVYAPSRDHIVVISIGSASTLSTANGPFVRNTSFCLHAERSLISGGAHASNATRNISAAPFDSAPHVFPFACYASQVLLDSHPSTASPNGW